MDSEQGIPLIGCRLDVLGHALKAIGLLRAISHCASDEMRDQSAEGWWDTERACFRIQSGMYPNIEKLREFLAKHYEPTPVIAAWNKSGGVSDKVQLTISGDWEAIRQFAKDHGAELTGFGLTAKSTRDLESGKDVRFATDAKHLDAIRTSTKSKDVALLIDAVVSGPLDALNIFREKQTSLLAQFGFAANKRIPRSGEIKLTLPYARLDELQLLLAAAGLPSANIRKESAKKDGVLPSAERLLLTSDSFANALRIAREFAPVFQTDDAPPGETISAMFRDRLDDTLGEAFDSLCAIHVSRQNDNPLFIRRGRPGNKVNADIFLNYWEYFVRFKKNPNGYVDASLFGLGLSGANIGDLKGKGTPFFPDAVKRFNQGTEWVTEDAPFCPLDYLLAVEGAIAMRGATSKTLNAQSRSRAAFPFVFDGVETMTDENGDVVGSDVAASFWYPLWNRPTTYAELGSYILDAQTRLPTKDCRFSGDFARAVRSQGTDAGFVAFQEFRFKLKGASVPWTTAGRYVPCAVEPETALLNELLAPLDANGVLEQFRFAKKTKDDLHRYRLPVLEAIDEAIAEPTPEKIIEVLCRVAGLNADLARSESLRDKVSPSGRVRFIPPLPCSMWDAAFGDFERDNSEFEIARALASITGHGRQPDNTVSPVEPFLGSLVPLKRRGSNWILPVKPELPSAQAVWSGTDLYLDLAAILARRYLDSAKDKRSALLGRRSASLDSILSFLHGELNDRRIARLVMGLSLIDWSHTKATKEEPAASSGETDEDDRHPVPLPYAALRTLIEVGINPPLKEDAGDSAQRAPKPLSPQAIKLLCRRTPQQVAAATCEALRRLAIVGVKNTYGKVAREQKPYLRGRDVISLPKDQNQFRVSPELAQRLAAAALIPLDWRDRWTVFRCVTLPQVPKTSSGDTES